MKVIKVSSKISIKNILMAKPVILNPNSKKTIGGRPLWVLVVIFSNITEIPKSLVKSLVSELLGEN